MRSSTASTTPAKLTEIVTDSTVDLDAQLLAARRLFRILTHPGRERSETDQAYCELKRLLRDAEGATLMNRLDAVASDSRTPVAVRLVAARHFLGAAVGMMLSS